MRVFPGMELFRKTPVFFELFFEEENSMKRTLPLLTVLIALLVLVLTLTACSDNENVQSESTKQPRTITIYSITGKTTSADAIAQVQKALNKITESQYKTHVVLKLFTEDQYETELSKALDAYNNRVTTPTAPVGTDEVAEITMVNENGRPITVYPDVAEGQVDIFLIPEGVSKFDEYTKNYLLEIDSDGTEVRGSICTDLSGQISADGKGFLLNQYIPATVLNYCRLNPIDSSSALYGIPSNRYYGDAEYMLINKKLFEEYNYDASIIEDMYSVQSFLCDLAADCKAGRRPGTVPLYNTPGMNLVSITGKKSVVAQYVAENATAASGQFTPMNIFSIPSVQKAMGFVNAINVAGGIMPQVTENVDFSTEFGAAFVYGNASIPDVYGDDYYVILTGVPMADNADIYKGIYAVSNNASSYVDRCMEILTCMNTNADFRNLFGYGVENMNYIVDEETGFVNKINDSYEMDLEATGNMFLLKQNSDMSEEELVLSANTWKIAKATNNRAIVSPYTKFEFSTKYYASEYNSLSTYVPMALTVPELEKLYDEIWIWISEFPSYISPDSGEHLNTFNEYLLVLQRELNKNIYVSSASSTADARLSLRQQYVNWYGVTYGDNPG